MVYKHAISTVVPARNVRLADRRRRHAACRGRFGGLNDAQARAGLHCLTVRVAANAPSSSASVSGRAPEPDRVEEFARWRVRPAPKSSRSSPARARRRIPRFLIGTGKVEELRARHRGAAAPTSWSSTTRCRPSQERNLEKELECRVLDRTGLILDIFAQRARTLRRQAAGRARAAASTWRLAWCAAGPTSSGRRRRHRPARSR